MSLVGPRPLLPEYLPRCSATQARRHELRPGMTGWAAVQGGSAASWERRLALDVWYVDHWSLALDLKILLMATIKALRPENSTIESSPTMPRRDHQAARETAPQAAQIQAPVLPPEAGGWRIKRVHERAKTVA